MKNTEKINKTNYKNVISYITNKINYINKCNLVEFNEKLNQITIEKIIKTDYNNIICTIEAMSFHITWKGNIAVPINTSTLGGRSNSYTMYFNISILFNWYVKIHNYNLKWDYNWVRENLPTLENKFSSDNIFAYLGEYNKVDIYVHFPEWIEDGYGHLQTKKPQTWSEVSKEYIIEKWKEWKWYIYQLFDPYIGSNKQEAQLSFYKEWVEDPYNEYHSSGIEVKKINWEWNIVPFN